MADNNYGNQCEHDCNAQQRDIERKGEHKESFKAEFGVLTSKKGLAIIKANLFVFGWMSIVGVYHSVHYRFASRYREILYIVDGTLYYFFIDFLVLYALVVLGQKYVNRSFMNAAFYWYQFFVIVIAFSWGYAVFKLSDCGVSIKAYLHRHTNATISQKLDDTATVYCSLQFIGFGLLCILAFLRMTLIFKHKMQMMWDVTLLSFVVIAGGFTSYLGMKLQESECYFPFNNSIPSEYCNPSNVQSLVSTSKILTGVTWAFGSVLLLFAVYIWLLHFDRSRMAKAIVGDDYKEYQRIWKQYKPLTSDREYEDFQQLDAECCALLGYQDKKLRVEKLGRKRDFFKQFFRKIYQPITDLDVLLVHAEFVQEWFDQVLKELHKKLPGSCKCANSDVNVDDVLRCLKCNGLCFIPCKPKSRTRALEKIQRSYRGRNEAVVDFVRGSLVCENFTDIKILLQMLRPQNLGNGGIYGDLFHIEQITNRFRPENDENASKTGGYRDIQIKVRTVGFRFNAEVDEKLRRLLQDPFNKMKHHVAELQIHLPEFFKVKNRKNGSRTHKDNLQELLIEDGNDQNHVTFVQTDQEFDLVKRLEDVEIVYSRLRRLNKNTNDKIAAQQRLQSLDGHKKYKLRRSLLDE
eukprot:m.286808 g.286808  ORF g.286808 m.286808 type:complete len:633 (-) comp16353_c2_seq23:107-2005(-)